MATYIVGAGAIGISVGYALHAAGCDLTFVERDPEKVASGRLRGFHVNAEPPRWIPIISFDDLTPTPADTILLCVKCFDNASVLERVPHDVEVIPIQNGYDQLLDARQHGLEGIASYVAHCQAGSTHVEITRPGELHIGDRNDDLAGRTVAMRDPTRTLRNLKTHLFNVVTSDDIRPIKATKLMYNAAISPLAAAAGLDNGELLSEPLARMLFFALLKENYAILRAANVPLGKVGPFHPRTVSRILKTPGLARVMAKFFVRSLRGTYCSMAGDIQKGRTELDNYTGHLLRLAEGRMAAPCNRAVYDVVSAMAKPDRGALAAIAGRIHKNAST